MIRVLDPAVVGRIAAGEVVERPQSAVKELLENAIDAGATNVTVEIRDGGIGYLRVTDNGCGIPAKQALTAFENHATSKLVSAEQLDDIRTLGFRGEALPSIAAVARVEMTTREKGSPSGVRVTIDENGRRVSDAGCPEGTTVTVRDLFYNTPARSAFLKKPGYEASLVTETVARMILASPAVSIRYINNSRVVYRSYGDGDIRHAAYAVYGKDVARLLTAVDESEGASRLTGFVGLGELSRPTRSQCTFFINGRVVRSPLLTRALEEACEERVPRGSYPMCALSLTMAAGNVDVNVHPNKLEVRFRDEEQVHAAVLAMLRRALGGGNALDGIFAPRGEDVKVMSRVTQTAYPEGDAAPRAAAPQGQPALETPAGAAESGAGASPAQEVREDGPAYFVPIVPAAHEDVPPLVPRQPGDVERAILRDEESMRARARAAAEREAPQRDAQEKKPDVPEREAAQGGAAQTRPTQSGGEAPGGARKDEGGEKKSEVRQTQDLTGAGVPYRVIGTLFRTYILLETESAMVMIDQHAAHERLQYDRFKKRLDEGSASQMLLEPQVVELSPSEAAAVRANGDVLRSAGYETEPFGENSVRVLSVPFLFGRADMGLLFTQLADRLGELSGEEREARLEEVMRFSCHRSVRAGCELSGSEIASLLDMLARSSSPPTCPHGRPIFRVFPRRELERQFGRIK